MNVKALLIVYLLLTTTYGGTSVEAEERLYEQLKRAVIRLEHFEVVHQEGSVSPIQKLIPDGTAFFVEHNKELYVVSARHVVDKPHSLRARVQCLNLNNEQREIIMLELPREKWVFHPMGGDEDTHPVDVAAMKTLWIKNRSIKYFRYVSESSKEYDKNQLPLEDPVPPQSILVFGFPLDIGFELTEQIPLSRSGIISMTTGKEFIKINNKFVEERCCLIDARMFSGNSGSPVMNELRINDRKPRLLGLVIAANNSLDFGIIEPVSRIREVLDKAATEPMHGVWKLINR